VSAPERTPPHFLIVEDSPAVRQVLSLHLRRFRGSRVSEASNGAEAVGKLSAGGIDLVLTDINMPVMDGLKLVSLVRSNPQLKDIPIIIITTKGAEEDRERGLALGANAYLPKPIQASELLRTIEKLLPPAAP
jgi:two-component system chemotaxis response regulator CheY